MTVDVRALLELSAALQGAATFTGILNAAKGAVARTTRYRATWLAVIEDTPDGQWVRILAMAGEASELVWEQTPRFPVGADPLLREIVEGDHPVVVDDMRTDPRTDKEMVARTDIRTSITIPMRIGGATLGALCVGTFASEGVVPPTPDEVENLTVTASLVAAAFDRVRLLFQRNVLDEQARLLADKGRALEEQVHHLQRLESAGQLASGIAHDFNNLLTAIAGHAEISLEEMAPGPVAESLQVILEATKRGAQLTHNLLSFSRRRVLSRRSLDLNEIVGQAQRLILPALRKEIDLRFSPAADRVPVFVDDVEIQHAVINLVTNARDAILDVGSISVEVGTVQLAEDFVTRHEGRLVGTCAVVSVSDTGVGIPQDTLAQVFEPFFTTKATGRGTGLGLATVRSLVDQHGGVVAVESEPGKGTTFSIYLPLATGTLASAREHAASPGAGGGGETILLAEDDDMVRALLTRVLRGHGYQVLVASDGQAAIELFRAESARVHLVLTDLMMPGRTGLELVNAVLAFQQRTAIVVMSGYTSDPAGAVHLSELGIPVITKPTTPTEVLVKIRQVLDDAAGSVLGHSVPAASR